MKKLVLFLILCAAAFAARGQKVDDPEYNSIMITVLAELDSAKDSGDLMICRNRFEMISQKYSDHWLPAYYIAYCDIETVYRDKQSDKNQARLDDAKKHLEQLDKFKYADKSEISTLWGYYHTAVISMDPAANGQKHFSKVYDAYDKAIEQSADNPRPIVLRLFFDKFIPEFIRPKRDEENDMAKAGELFAKEKRNSEKPYWGEYYFLQIKNQNN